MAIQGKGILDAPKGGINNLLCYKRLNSSIIQLKKGSNVDNGVFSSPYVSVAPINVKNCVVGNYFSSLTFLAGIFNAWSYIPLIRDHRLYQLRFRISGSQYYNFIGFREDSFTSSKYLAPFSIRIRNNRLQVRSYLEVLHQVDLDFLDKEMILSVYGSLCKVSYLDSNGILVDLFSVSLDLPSKMYCYIMHDNKDSMVYDIQVKGKFSPYKLE